MDLVMNVADWIMVMDYGRRLFEGLDFVLTAGAKVGLVGPNGSGKTTFLRLLRGEIEPAQGMIRRAEALRIVYFSQTRELTEGVTLRRALAPDSSRTSKKLLTECDPSVS